MKIYREGEEFKSVLDLLEKARVFNIGTYETNFMIQEMCDRYFEVTLSPRELRELGRELIALAETKIV